MHAQAVAQSLLLYNVASRSALSCAGPRRGAAPGPGGCAVAICEQSVSSRAENVFVQSVLIVQFKITKSAIKNWTWATEAVAGTQYMIVTAPSFAAFINVLWVLH